MRDSLTQLSAAAFAVIVFTSSAAFGQGEKPKSEAKVVKKLDVVKTIDGRKFREVEILQRDPHGITFRHSTGTAKLPFAELTRQIRDKYGYDLEKARKFLRKHSAVQPRAATERHRTRRVSRTSVAWQYLPMTYTSFIAGWPVTQRGLSFAQANRASRYVPPSWVHPVPVNAPFNSFLWRQLQLCDHLVLSRALHYQPVAGFGTVARRIHQAGHFPKIVSRSVPAIGSGRGVPAIGSRIRAGY